MNLRDLLDPDRTRRLLQRRPDLATRAGGKRGTPQPGRREQHDLDRLWDLPGAEPTALPPARRKSTRKA